jgi:hypothetical protein
MGVIEGRPPDLLIGLAPARRSGRAIAVVVAHHEIDLASAGLMMVRAR